MWLTLHQITELNPEQVEQLSQGELHVEAACSQGCLIATAADL
jgi:hypothetical protein